MKLLLAIAGCILIGGCSGVARSMTCVNGLSGSQHERIERYERASIVVVDSKFFVGGQEQSEDAVLTYFQKCGNVRGADVIKQHRKNIFDGFWIAFVSGAFLGLGSVSSGEYAGLVTMAGSMGLLQSAYLLERGVFYRQRASKIFNKDLAYTLEIQF